MNRIVITLEGAISRPLKNPVLNGILTNTLLSRTKHEERRRTVTVRPTGWTLQTQSLGHRMAEPMCLFTEMFYIYFIFFIFISFNRDHALGFPVPSSMRHPELWERAALNKHLLSE